MDEQKPRGLEGLRVLIVEDDYNIASNLSRALKIIGAEIIGPVGTVADGLSLIEKTPILDAALLDIHLGAENAFPIAQALFNRGIPFIFTTGYSRSSIPPVLADAPLLEKPIDVTALARLLTGIRTIH